MENIRAVSPPWGGRHCVNQQDKLEVALLLEAPRDSGGEPEAHWPPMHQECVCNSMHPTHPIPPHNQPPFCTALAQCKVKFVAAALQYWRAQRGFHLHAESGCRWQQHAWAGLQWQVGQDAQRNAAEM